MANRTNKQNRTLSRSCLVCSSSAPQRTEPNNTFVRFVFGRISNIDNFVRFCSNQTRPEQYPCSARVRQVRTTRINFKYKSDAWFSPLVAHMYIAQLSSVYRTRLFVDLSVKYSTQSFTWDSQFRLLTVRYISPNILNKLEPALFGKLSLFRYFNKGQGWMHLTRHWNG